MENLKNLIKELCKQYKESEWLEFKHNNCTPEMIGQDISALANGAAMCEKSHAYMIWGVDDKTHEIIGTDFDLNKAKKGNQELENWLRCLLSKNTDFNFESVVMDGKNVGVLKINRAVNQTVTFEKMDYIRVGSYTKKLNDFPNIESELWEKLRNHRFEKEIVKSNLKSEDVLKLINLIAYFDIKNIPMPSTTEGMIHYFEEEQMILKQDNGLYSITNLGAILFAKDLTNFPSLERKALRVVQYKGINKLEMLREETINVGYAIGLNPLMKYMEALLPMEEVINGAIRETKRMYPPIAIREIIANALIHQDFSIRGTGVVVEVFDNRIEVTNPGDILVDIERIVDNPPRSRNEILASLMRKLKMCEELGTGWDKIILSCELYKLPAPRINIYEDSTKVTLLCKIPFSKLTSDDKLLSCYMHACIKYVQNDYLTNTSLRERFGVDSKSSANISRLIKDACEKHLIKKLEDTAPRYTKYVPFWA